MPIERLAQLLVQCARADAALPRRTPANDDSQHARYVDAMYKRLETLPDLRSESQAMRLAPQVASPLVPAAAVASNEDLEELVAIALTSAQDAEDVSRAANEASRKARRGMFVAVALAAIGVTIASTAAISARRYAGDNRQMAEIARQVQALGDWQQHINEQLTGMQAQRAVQDVTAVQTQPGVAPPRHEDPGPVPPAPLKATEVRVLPAEPAAAPQTSPGATEQQSRSDPQPVSYAPAAAYAAAPLAPLSRTYSRQWTPYHPPARRYRADVVLPRPVAYFFGSVRRDVRALFR